MSRKVMVLVAPMAVYILGYTSTTDVLFDISPPQAFVLRCTGSANVTAQLHSSKIGNGIIM